MDRLCLVFGAGFGLLGVALGAFGAHALKAQLEPRMLDIFETGVRYQMYHALALLLLAALAGQLPDGATAWPGRLFVAGILLFSGSLYLLAISGITWLGAVTPLGGLCLLAGWGLLLFAALRS